ncbi:MAG: toprim domain-containing protein [Candidatus Hadarchaeum sp.]|uniref:toprim domain-containing protein n=1 Tax=Candidatus Hadarchaeum sp. TaxID=2883567 RepID=UPI003D09BEF3
MLTEETLEQINELLIELNKLASDGVPIVVEGREDEKALKTLGVSGRFCRISSGNSLLNFVERLSGSREIVILTDFDRTGEELAKFINKHAKRLGIEPITEFRERLKPLVRRNVKDVEGLAKFLQKERER